MISRYFNGENVRFAERSLDAMNMDTRKWMQ